AQKREPPGRQGLGWGGGSPMGGVSFRPPAWCSEPSAISSPRGDPMADSLRVGVVQLSSQDDVAKNLARAVELVAKAASEGAKLVVLPENFAFMGTEEGKRALAESLDGAASGPIRTALAEAAKRSGVTIVAGGMPERSATPTVRSTPAPSSHPTAR